MYFGYAPFNKEANAKALNLGHVPHFSILDFRQLPFLLSVMNEDARFINEQSDTFQDEYRHAENFRRLPSSKRIRVGLLQDGDGIN